MSDERKGLPSASEYHRIVGCPGYLNAKAKLPADIPKETSAEAESGTRIASAMADEPLACERLNDEELSTYAELRVGRADICEAVFQKTPEELELTSESRIWIKNSEGPIFSGKYDAMYRHENTALIIDDKSGRNEVTQADGNLQLRSLALAVWIHDPTIARIFVAINQPLVKPKFSIAEYDVQALARAHSEFALALSYAADPESPLKAGKHCDYCPVRKVCPAQHADTIMTISTHPALTLATSENLAAFLDWVDTHDPVSTIDSVKKEVKRRIQAGETITGWALKPGRITETITDPELVFTRCDRAGVAQADFMKSVKIGKGALKDALASATGKKGKALADLLDEVIAGAVTESQSEPSLVREKKELA